MEKFMIRKWLLSMFEGEERILPASKMKYQNVKASTSQMKTLGYGEWKVSKKRLGDYTRIIRIK
jgi:hypothetical protein